jgi:hypothetical protein
VKISLGSWHSGAEEALNNSRLWRSSSAPDCLPALFGTAQRLIEGGPPVKKTEEKKIGMVTLLGCRCQCGHEASAAVIASIGKQSQ